MNRAREQLGAIVVHPPEEFSEKLYGEPVGILEKSWEAVQANPAVLSESDLLNLVEQVYDGNDLSQNDAFLQIKTQTEQERTKKTEPQGEVRFVVPTNGKANRATCQCRSQNRTYLP